MDGVVAQLVERLVRNEKVAGSIPVGSTKVLPDGFFPFSFSPPEHEAVMPVRGGGRLDVWGKKKPNFRSVSWFTS